MEDNNYRDGFELFLKESADDFKMVPSRKVWYSLYNNLHPDRKWPSMAVCLLILTAVLYIGIANNNSLSNNAKKIYSENFSNTLAEKNIQTKLLFSLKDYTKTISNKQQQSFITINKIENNVAEKSMVFSNVESIKAADEETAAKQVETINTDKYLDDRLKIKNVSKSNIQKAAIPANTLADENKIYQVVLNNAVIGNSQENDVAVVNEENTATLFEKDILLNIEKSWKEDYAFRNKPALNKFKQNSTFSYYITPSVGYRSFSKSSGSIKPTLPTSYALASTGYNGSELFDNAAINLEIGATLQYNITKTLRLKSGVQANYINYVSNVTALGHPSQTSITLNNNNTNIRSANYSTKAGNNKLNKTNIQIALPLGADYKVTGNSKFNWYIGGTLQPTYVVGGNAFVLSSDEKYYISENSLLRKTNLNTSIETFISFKSSNGVVLNVGPQFRYQLFSTYKKQYGYSEKLYNVGIKVGVTTSF